MPRTCTLCPAPSGRNRYCPAHRTAGRDRQREASSQHMRDQWGRWKATGQDPTHTAETAQARSEAITRRNLAGEAGRALAKRRREEQP